MADAPAGRFTVADLKGPDNRRAHWRRTPRITIDSLRLVWRSSPGGLVATFVLQVVAAAATGVQLLVVKHLVQQLLGVSAGTESVGALLPAFAALIAATVLVGTTAALTQHQQQLLYELVVRHTFDRIIGVSSTVSYEAFEDPEFHDQLERARTSGMFRPIEMVTSVTTLLTAILTSAGIAVALLTMEPLLLPIIALAAVPLLLATLHNSRLSYVFDYQLTPQNRERIYLQELLTRREAAKEMRAFGNTGFLRGRYDALTDERVSLLRAFLAGRLKISLLGTAASALGGGLAMGALVVFLATDRIGVATAVAAAVAMQLLASRLSSITTSVGKLIEASMFLDDYNAFVAAADEPSGPKLASGSTRASARRFEGLRVEDVSFTYPRTERPVLEDVSVRIDPGEVVALVGENGSGKTTLVKLVCQLYRPQTGRVLWNGVDAADLPPEEVRSDMTVIFQDFVQYHLTARENIALGRVERPHDIADIVSAAEHGGAHDFLSQLPEAYDTRLGRQFYGGHELSIGQWQRLALSRAFYRDGGFLVLDEPTAALDPRAEHELFNQMRGLARGRSVLLVSHRFSSVRTADRIYVMQHGRITESGSHDELIAAGGHYAELFELQAAAYLGEIPSAR